MRLDIRRVRMAFLNAALIFPLALHGQQTPAAGGSASAATSRQNAQPGDGQARQQQMRRLGALAQSLNLSDDQKREWMRIQRETTQNVRTTRKDDSLSEEQMQQKLREIHTQQRQQLLALLTPEQQDALKKFWEDQRQKQQAKNDAGGQDGSNANTASGKTAGKDDDFFSGMVQDEDQPNKPPQGKPKPTPPPL